MRQRIAIITMFALVALASRSRAGDGQTDILPTSSTPFVISQPGSYALVADVTMTADVSGIQVTANDVTIDLGGHTITGTGAGTAVIGIDVTSRARVTIRNGGVKGFSGIGIGGTINGTELVLEDLRITGCGGNGFECYRNARVSRVIANGNGDSGFRAGSAAIVEDCQAEGNKNWGILADSGSTIQRCTAYNNGATSTFIAGGIWGGGGSVIQDCVVQIVQPAGSSLVTGILGSGASRIMNNVVGSVRSKGSSQCIGIQGYNGCSISGNIIVGVWATETGRAWGISAGDRSIITDNTVSSVSSSGDDAKLIQCGTRCIVRGNTLEGATPGVLGSGFGIDADEACEIAGNRVSELVDSDSAATTALGISAGLRSRVIGNICEGAVADVGGDAIGIRCNGKSVVKDNLCSNNTCSGPLSSGIGIQVLGDDNRVEDNEISDNVGGYETFGILVGSVRNAIIKNRTSGHSTGTNNAGIRLANGSTGNRVQENLTSETNDISDVSGGANSLSANVGY